MRYFSEETVRQIIKDAMEYGMRISQTQPMDIESYPSIEIKEPHGRCIDADELEKVVEKMVICDSYEYTIAHEMVKKLLKMAPTVLEAAE